MTLQQMRLLCGKSKGGQTMLEENFILEISAIGSDDGLQTYEIRRTLSGEGKKSLVVELYPTLMPEEAYRMDSSTMHLMNHAGELGWTDIRVVNIYSNVCNGKPRVAELNDADNSIDYIRNILEEDDIHEYDIVIAWGSALLNHKETNKLKVEILNLIKGSGLGDNVKCIVTDNLFVEENIGIHPLFLGLRHGKDEWQLIDYPIDDEIVKLGNGICEEKQEATKGKRGRKKNVSKIKECA